MSSRSKLDAMRNHGETYGDIIMRLVEQERR